MIDLEDLWDADEWHDLPDDDGEAFARLVVLARPRFESRLASAQNSEKDALRFHYMTNLMGIAKDRKVAPFCNQETPYLRNFSSDFFEDFEADLRLHLAKTQSRKAKRAAEGMVNLTTKDSAVLRLHLKRMREKLEATEMEAWRKKRLMAKLDEFEEALRKGRVDLRVVATIAVTLVTLPGGIYGSLQAAGIDFQKDILAPIAEAKCASEKEEWQQKALFSPKPRLLSRPESIARIAGAPKPKPSR